MSDYSNRQVMDIKTSKGIADSSNEQLRKWTERGWDQAMKEGNYDRSREHLNFEIVKGGKVVPVDKSHPLTERMAENLAARGIKDPNERLVEPRYRTVVNFIFGGSTDRMRELAFGNQEVDFESKSGNEHIKRMPEIEQWAKDVYNFVARKYGEENILSFIVHLDEKNPHVHCSLLPIIDNKFSFKKLFAGRGSLVDFKNNLLKLHDELAEVNEKWGLVRGSCITETGAKHRSTEEYRRWLDKECTSLAERRSNLQKAIEELNRELAVCEKKHKSFTTMIENLTSQKENLEKELQPLRELQKNGDAISQEIAQKIQNLENRKALVEEKLAEKEAKLSSTAQEIDSLRQDKEALEQEASELVAKASASEQDWAHSKGAVMNELLAGTMMHEFTSCYQRLPDEAKEVFGDTLLEQLATDGNHVATVALALMCEYVEQATSIAQTHGGGGGGPGGGWRKKDDEDERMFARRSLAMARRMCRTSGRRKKM